MIPSSDEVRREQARRALAALARGCRRFLAELRRLAAEFLRIARPLIERLFPAIRRARVRADWYAAHRQQRLARTLASWPVTDGTTLAEGPAP